MLGPLFAACVARAPSKPRLAHSHSSLPALRTSAPYREKDKFSFPESTNRESPIVALESSCAHLSCRWFIAR